jgi:hypothetical protein
MVINEYWRINHLLLPLLDIITCNTTGFQKISKKYQWVSHIQKPTSSPVPPRKSTQTINRKSTAYQQVYPQEIHRVIQSFIVNHAIALCDQAKPFCKVGTILAILLYYTYTIPPSFTQLVSYNLIIYTIPPNNNTSQMIMILK